MKEVKKIKKEMEKVKEGKVVNHTINSQRR